MTATLAADFKVTNAGTIFLFRPLTNNARHWVEVNLEVEDWQRLGDAFGVDHRPAVDLVNVLLDEGFVLQ